MSLGATKPWHVSHCGSQYFFLLWYQRLNPGLSYIPSPYYYYIENRISLSCPGLPWSWDPPASAEWLGLQACAIPVALSCSLLRPLSCKRSSLSYWGCGWQQSLWMWQAGTVCFVKHITRQIVSIPKLLPFSCATSSTLRVTARIQIFSF